MQHKDFRVLRDFLFSLMLILFAWLLHGSNNVPIILVTIAFSVIVGIMICSLVLLLTKDDRNE